MILLSGSMLSQELPVSVSRKQPTKLRRARSEGVLLFAVGCVVQKQIIYLTSRDAD